MNLLDLIFIAIGLAMDTVAVTISNVLYEPHLSIKKGGAMAVSFGVFQALMPVIGFYAATLFSQYITAFDHWIALILLSFLGGKMIYESLGTTETSTRKNFSFATLMIQSLATSIDALAVGISFSALGVNLWISVAIIAVITATLSFSAFFIARKLGSKFGKTAEIVGGCILILIGIKIFIEHMFM